MKDIKEFITEGIGAIRGKDGKMHTYPGELFDEFKYDINAIKSWWHDKKAHKIIDKIIDDPDIMGYFEQPKNKQRSGWVDLLKSKLSEDEYKYIYKITKAKVQDKLKVH